MPGKLILSAIATVLAAILFVAGAAYAEDPMQPGARVAANDYYDAYYDGQLGPFADGYWGTDGHFWYEGGSSSAIWARDEASHFRHTPAPGYDLVHGTGVHREN